MKFLIPILLICPFAFGQVTNNFSIEFDGTDDVIEAGAPVTQQQSILSVGAYVKLNTLTHSNDPQANIVEQAVNGQWNLGYDLPTKSYMFGVKVGGTWYKVYTPADSLVWQNVVGTFDKVNNTIRIYLDGSLSDELTTVPSGNLDSVANYPFAVGGRSGFSKTIDGKIDDVHVWRAVLDSNQIQQLMDCPPNGTEQGLMLYYNFEFGSGTTAFDQISVNNGTLLNGPIWSGDSPYYNCGVGIEEKVQSPKTRVKIIDLMGREVSYEKNKVLIYVYSDGTTERVYELD